MDVGAALQAGLALGAAYALIGAAVSTVALATRTLHLAVGAVLVGGVLLRLVLGIEALSGLPPAAAIGAGLAAGGLVSALLEPLLLARLRPGVTWLVGLAVAGGVLELLVARTLGTRTVRPEPLLAVGDVTLGPVTVAGDTAVALLVGVPAAVVLGIVVARTRWGRRVRLVGGSPEGAARAGISPSRVRAGALAVGGVAAVLAGLLVTPITFVGVGQSAAFTIRGVAAAALLGRGRPPAAIAGGLLLGLVEAFAQAAWPQVGGEVAVAALVVVVLAWRGGESQRAWGRAW